MAYILELTSTGRREKDGTRVDEHWHQEAGVDGKHLEAGVFSTYEEADARGRDLFMKCACDAWRVKEV
ncbi:MAG: hypothetical protein ABSF77_18555 [Spirochaetia bacterium]|jgi:hypothetical protein